MAFEALYKDSKYRTRGVVDEFGKLNNLEVRTVKVLLNNEHQCRNNTEGAMTSVAEKCHCNRAEFNKLK